MNCKSCGAELKQFQCAYCHTDNDVMFVTKEEYNKLQMNPCFVPIMPENDVMGSIHGQAVVIRS